VTGVRGCQVSEITSGTNLTVIVLDEEKAEQLNDLLNTHPTLMEDYPALVYLDLGLGV
jgi:hypothetical protein